MLDRRGWIAPAVSHHFDCVVQWHFQRNLRSDLPITPRYPAVARVAAGLNTWGKERSAHHDASRSSCWEKSRLVFPAQLCLQRHARLLRPREASPPLRRIPFSLPVLKHLSPDWHHVETHYLPPFLDWGKTGRAGSSELNWCFGCAQHFGSLATEYYPSRLNAAPGQQLHSCRDAGFQSPKEMSTSRAVCTSSPFGGTSFNRLTASAIDT